MARGQCFPVPVDWHKSFMITVVHLNQALSRVLVKINYPTVVVRHWQDGDRQGARASAGQAVRRVQHHREARRAPHAPSAFGRHHVGGMGVFRRVQPDGRRGPLGGRKADHDHPGVGCGWGLAWVGLHGVKTRPRFCTMHWLSNDSYKLRPLCLHYDFLICTTNNSWNAGCPGLRRTLLHVRGPQCHCAQGAGHFHHHEPDVRVSECFAQQPQGKYLRGYR